LLGLELQGTQALKLGQLRAGLGRRLVLRALRGVERLLRGKAAAWARGPLEALLRFAQGREAGPVALPRRYGRVLVTLMRIGRAAASLGKPSLIEQLVKNGLEMLHRVYVHASVARQKK
jgi:hypothetical protein